MSGGKIKSLVLFLILVGNIKCQLSHDEKAFFRCDSERIYEYYQVNTHYAGGTRALKAFFAEHYKIPKNIRNQTGLIRIRFQINCLGETGNFNVQEMNAEYKKFKFDRAISKQLLKLTKTLEDWVPGEHHDTKYDSNMYLLFRLKDGVITEIVP